MAQLGDLVRAKALLWRSAARAFRSGKRRWPAREVRRRRGRGSTRLARPGLAGEGTLDAARATLRGARRPGERRAGTVRRRPGRLLLIRAPRRGRADTRRARLPRPSRPRRGPPMSWWSQGCAPRRLQTKAAQGAALARAEIRRARLPYPSADQQAGRKRIQTAEHARGATNREEWRGTPAAASRTSRRCRRRRRSSWTRAVMSCAMQTRRSRSRSVRFCSRRSHARSARRGRETCRGIGWVALAFGAEARRRGSHARAVTWRVEVGRLRRELRPHWPA